MKVNVNEFSKSFLSLGNNDLFEVDCNYSQGPERWWTIPVQKEARRKPGESS